LVPPETATTLVSSEQTLDVPLVSVTVNGGVPPVIATVADTVAVWPASTPGGDRVTVRDRAVFTVTVAAVAVVATSGTVALSVTVAQ
jgi:hypothetical protein